MEHMALTSCRSWDLSFTAEPEEVAALRRTVRSRLEAWRLPDVRDSAELCVGELVANVITHVGRGTPTTLAMSLARDCLRIEVHDPDARALPTLIRAEAESESGRGMALVDAIASRWGVELRPDRKVTWCELATDSAAGSGGLEGLGQVVCVGGQPAPYPQSLGTAGTHRPGPSGLVAEATVIALVSGFCHWLASHGFDVDHVFERAQANYEAETGITADVR